MVDVDKERAIDFKEMLKNKGSQLKLKNGQFCFSQDEKYLFVSADAND